MLPGSLEWWHVIVSILAIVFTIGMKAFGNAFNRWADKLDNFQRSVDKRLTHIEHTFSVQSRDMAARFEEHRENIHRLTVHVERRVTWLEALLRSNAPSEDVPHPKRRWYDPPKVGPEDSDD